MATIYFLTFDRLRYIMIVKICIICASSPYNPLETSCLSRSLAFITWGIDVERVGRFLILE